MLYWLCQIYNNKKRTFVFLRKMIDKHTHAYRNQDANAIYKTDIGR